MSKFSSKSISKFLIEHQWIEISKDIWTCEANCYIEISATAAYKIQTQLNELESRRKNPKRN